MVACLDKLPLPKLEIEIEIRDHKYQDSRFSSTVSA
jgi:hypothetical protein